MSRSRAAIYARSRPRYFSGCDNGLEGAPRGSPRVVRVELVEHRSGRKHCFEAKSGQGGNLVLTKDILFGMNVLTFGGFLVMGLSITLQRMGNAGIPLSIGLMCAGTALVLFGLFAVDSSE